MHLPLTSKKKKGSVGRVGDQIAPPLAHHNLVKIVPIAGYEIRIIQEDFTRTRTIRVKAFFLKRALEWYT